MNTVLEYVFHRLPRYVLVVFVKGMRSESAETLQNWKEKSVGSFGSLRPCAVMVFFWLGRPFLGRRSWQF